MDLTGFHELGQERGERLFVELAAVAAPEVAELHHVDRGGVVAPGIPQAFDLFTRVTGSPVGGLGRRSLVGIQARRCDALRPPWFRRQEEHRSNLPKGPAQRG